MVNWYYVDGAERIGPVSFEALKELYSLEKINQETYVWKKGYANWERLKNVSELNFISEVDQTIAEVIEESIEIELMAKPITDGNSPLYIEPFSWKNLNKSKSIFYLNIGRDRNQNKSQYFGPYSFEELIMTFKQKRINDNSLVFAMGLEAWQEIHSIPLLRETLELQGLTIPINVKSPYLFIGEDKSVIFELLVKDINLKQAIILTNSDLQIGQELKLSLFKGMLLKSKNIILRVESKNIKEQSYVLSIIEMNEEVVKAIHEFNE